ncbi:MAG: VWA domain-containing protein [Planctomycetes bacterium]|nr:VWA domain-containing protein [Planctomycetota bacterium]
MKTKLKAASIILALTGLILAGYFAGCGTRRADMAEKPQQVDQTVARRDGKDVQTKVIVEAGADNGDISVRTEQESKKRADILLKTDESGIPYADKITYPKDWWEIIDKQGRKGEVPVLGDMPIAGKSFKLDSGAYGMGGYGGYGGAMYYDGHGSFLPRGGYGGYGGAGYGGYGEGYGSSYSIDGRYLSKLKSDQKQLGTRGPGYTPRPGPGGPLPIDLRTVSADEIWIIAKSEVAVVARDAETPGCGAMICRPPGQEKEIPLPLKHTDVKGQISGYIATVEVTQEFSNPYDEKIEAVYVFPLPQNAAINEFIMVVGERKIRGIIRERQEAERIYKEARDQGHMASLLTQERPNIFTQKVANIEPGKKIDVNIKYFNTLAYVDGWYEFVFPMVVGPRFNPPGFTDGVGAVARGKAGISGQKTEVQYLKPGERSGHDISLTVDINAGVAIEEAACSNHAISKNAAAPEKLTVKLSPLDSIPNKDFVLRYRVAGRKLKSALVVHRDKRGGFFTLMLYPPANLSSLRRAPMEMIFVLDCSGSMSGKPIAKAKDAIRRALKKLEPDDTFQIIRFSNNASQLGPKPVPVTPENIRRGLKYVDSLKGSGGTQMIEGIKAALDFEHDPHRFRLVSFMTDGYIGNEAQILEAVQERLGESRIFSFGVGSSVNRYLLDRMAKLGRGAVAYIGLDDSAGEVVDLYYDRISHPALTDVTIDWGGMAVTDMYPRHIPDLFVGRPVILTGRFKGEGKTTINITGKVGGHYQDISIPIDLDDSSAAHRGIACVWARKKIEDLANQAIYDQTSDLPDEIKQVALEYGLMSAYTAFVAVDSSRKTAGDHGVTVAVPVPVPEGVRYETTVQN